MFHVLTRYFLMFYTTTLPFGHPLQAGMGIFPFADQTVQAPSLLLTFNSQLSIYHSPGCPIPPPP